MAGRAALTLLPDHLGRAERRLGGFARRHHAFSDPDSNSGFLVTAALLAESRLRPDQFFSRHFFTYGHRNVIRAVASGLAQSGSVDGYVWDVMRQIEPNLVGRTEIVRESELLGFPPVASAKSLASDARGLSVR